MNERVETFGAGFQAGYDAGHSDGHNEGYLRGRAEARHDDSGSPEAQAVVDAAVLTFRQCEQIPRQAWFIPELRDAIVSYLASRDAP